MRTDLFVQTRPDFSLDLLSHLRHSGLFSSDYGAPDELLLHSGGPNSDLSKRNDDGSSDHAIHCQANPRLNTAAIKLSTHWRYSPASKTVSYVN